LEAALAAGVQSVGFVFDPSPRRLDYDTARRLMAMVPDHVENVAVVGRPNERLLLEIWHALKPDCLQVMADAMPKGELADRLPLLPAFPDGPDLHRQVDAYLARKKSAETQVLADSAAPGTGVLTDWNRVAGLRSRCRLILAGGLTPRNVAEAIRQVKPWGVDLCSGVESSPGVKDPSLIEMFMTAVQSSPHADNGAKASEK
jgi:phosphoribosylanthranilate isomerase